MVQWIPVESVPIPSSGSQPVGAMASQADSCTVCSFNLLKLKLLVARYKLRGYKYSNQTFCTNQCPVWTVSIQLQFLYTARYKRIMCCLIPHVWLLDVSFMSAIFCSLPRWVKQVAKNSPSFCGFPGCLDEGNWRSSKPKKHHLPCTRFGCRGGEAWRGMN